MKPTPKKNLTKLSGQKRLNRLVIEAIEANCAYRTKVNLDEVCRPYKTKKYSHIYLAGQMTGLPGFNYPAFNKMQKKLEGQGFKVINPATLNKAGEPWINCLRNDLSHIVKKCYAIAVLDNWRNSRGARLEVSTASQLGLPIFNAETLELIDP